MGVKDRTYGGISVTERRDHRRVLFLDAGLAVFGEDGYQNASVSAICARANLARGHFYEQFSDREELLLAVYDRIQDDGRAAVTEALATLGDGDIETRARCAVDAYARSIGSDHRRAAVAFVEIVGVSARVEEHRLEQRAVWGEFIAAELKRALGEDYVPPGGWSAATTAIVGALIAMVEQWASSPTERARRLHDVSDVLVRFLLALT
ncbi:TetR/AcrR family transcriptional regulator [Gordonia sp. SL306]|uniref:TetR/AcrR family transcriptional regulator n=1 Tax=Gordonia sp. SL306 TaxID=2995145 RepID=UPI00226EBE62|nr:TetR/AcrR family transcriptional regulator [Gordonia sp. SL306]WAC57780.1 TetR/AcrR family transcriptional regulator [Gordonia sp. SL306]